MPKKTISGGKVAGAFVQIDDFVGELMADLKELGIDENTTGSSPWRTTDPWCIAHRRDGACCR